VRAASVQLDGAPCRFCQACERMQPLAAFCGDRRACTASLASHAARRRRAARADAAAAGALPLPLLGGEGVDDMSEDGADVALAWLEEFVPPAADAHSRVNALAASSLSPPPPLLLPLSRCVAAAHLCVKLPHDAPRALPAGGLRAAAARAFFRTPPPSASHSAAADASALLSLEASIHPGCTLLLLHAVLDAHQDGGADAAAEVNAHDALSAMLRDTGEGGAFLRAPGREVRVTDAAGRVAVARSGAIAATTAAEEEDVADADAGWLRVSPLAALATQHTPVTLPRAAAAAAGGLACSLHGQWLTVQPPASASASASSGVLGTLPPCGAEGAALLYRLKSDSGAIAPGGRPAVLLLTCDAAIVAEVARTEAQLFEAESRSGDSAESAQARARVQATLLALGHALRPGGCAPALGAHAAAGALAHGWRAAAQRVLASHAHHAPAALLLPGGVSLLHLAAQSGDGDAVALLLSCGGDAYAFGCPFAGSRDASSSLGAATPLHAAAAARSHAAVAALLAACPARAAVAWCASRDAAHGGATPSALVRDADAAAATPPDEALLALDVALRARVAAGTRCARAAQEALGGALGIFLPAEQAAHGPALLAQPPFRASLLRRGASEDALAIAAALFQHAAEACDASDDENDEEPEDEEADVQEQQQQQLHAVAVAPAPTQPARHASFLVERAAAGPSALASASASASASAGELAAFADDAAEASRPFVLLGVLLLLLIDFLWQRRHVRTPFTNAELATRAAHLTRDDLWRLYWHARTWTCPPASLALLVLGFAPATRRFYIRHNSLILGIQWALHFLFNHVLMERHIRAFFDVPTDMQLPCWSTQAHLMFTACSALLPMRATPLCALLVARACMSALGGRLQCWPMGGACAGGWVTQTEANAALTAVLVFALRANERRALRAWRAANAARVKGKCE
jgi:hypothetical protein